MSLRSCRPAERVPDFVAGNPLFDELANLYETRKISVTENPVECRNNFLSFNFLAPRWTGFLGWESSNIINVLYLVRPFFVST